jgi:hypothetical protein
LRHDKGWQQADKKNRCHGDALLHLGLLRFCQDSESRMVRLYVPAVSLSNHELLRPAAGF